MSSTTLKTILEDFVEEYDLGRVGTTTATDITTTLTDLTRFGGPFAGNEWNRGTPIRITARLAVAGGAVTVGSNTYVSDFTPATGLFTVLPALDDAPEIGTNFIVFYPDVVEHSDRMLEALNRFLTRVAERRMRVPFTYVPNGDYLATLVATGWTVNGNAVIAYSELAHPNGWYQRELKLTGGSTGLYVKSTTLPANAGETWNIGTTIRVGAAGDIASIVVQDETAGAAITPTYSKGTGTTSSLAPVEQIATFIIPTGCTQISIRPTVTANGDIGYFGPWPLAPANATLYTGQTALEYLKRVEGLWTFSAGTYGPVERRWSPVQYGRHDDQLGWGQGFSFESVPPFPLFADMLLGYPAMVAGDTTSPASGSAASENDTTACPEPLALAGMAVEFFKHAQASERRKLGDFHAPTKWDGPLDDAEAAMVVAQADWNAPKKVSVRKHFAGMASA